MISKLMSLLETLQTTENKKTLLRLIATLGENAENSIEIGAPMLPFPDSHSLA